MNITITGRIPSKKNSQTIVCRGKFPRLLPNKSYTAWHEGAMWQVKKHKPKNPIECSNIEITIYNDTERRFDLNNSSQSILDVLVDAQILVDDNAKAVPSLLMMYGGVDRKNPRAEIKISETVNTHT
jgi:Holliday junction resolvase RusA-like endonuclease